MNTSGSGEVNRKKLFAGICVALLPTAFSFALISNILYQLKTEFVLTNANVGFIGGGPLWGCALALLTIGLFLEKIGFKKAAIGAFVSHLTGVTLFLVAFLFAGQPSAFWILFLGAIVMGIGNGLVEVTGNPLTAALYPDQKTTKLNHFHAFFPGGMVLGGILGFLMVQAGMVGGIFLGHWTLQISITYIPILTYGYLLLTEKFPQTEGAEAGLELREMFRYTFTHPLVIGLILLMMLSLSMELGPMRWIPEVLQAAGLHGILVLVWISGLMMLLRLFAGPFVERFSPPGMLLGGAVLTAISLLIFSFVETGTLPLLVAATFFACGIAFFFPNMVGLMSERFPQAGSVGIVVLMGAGFIAAGASNPIMGGIADRYLPDALDEGQTVAVLQTMEERLPAYIVTAEAADGDPARLAQLGYRAADLQNTLNHTREALRFYQQEGRLHGNSVGNAFRAFLDSSLEQERELMDQAFALLRPADNYGGRMSFLWLVPLALIIGLIFLVVYINDMRQGGYKAIRLEKKV